MTVNGDKHVKWTPLEAVTNVAGAGVSASCRSQRSGWCRSLAALGLSEAFNQVSQMLFYYKQFPENMRSVAGSLLFSGLALSSYLSGLLVSVVRRATTGVDGDEGWLAEDLNVGRLDCFYFLIGAIGIADLLVFLACANWYRYKVSDDGMHEHDADGNWSS